MSIFIGLLFIVSLSAILGAILWKLGVRDRRAYLLFAISLLIHISAALFIYIADFQPFSGGGGDYGSYHKSAVRIADGIGQGNLFPDVQERGGVDHHFPTIIGYVYFLTISSMVVGQLFNAFIASVAIFILYFIVLEVSRSSRWAFGIGLLANLYPSFLFYSSLLLKDVFVILFALLSALLMLRLLKHFSWDQFALFCVFLFLLTHFRLYVGFIMLVTFIISWFFLSRKSLRARLKYAIPIVFILGFIPQMFGMGYYGFSMVRQYTDSDTLTYYQDIAYTGLDVAPSTESDKEESAGPTSPTESSPNQSKSDAPSTTPSSQPSLFDELIEESSKENIGFASTVDIKVRFSSPKAFLISAPPALAFVAIGPFPWHFSADRHYLALLETIPWTILSIFVLLGIIYALRSRHRALSLVIFSFGLFFILMVYMSNFGITTRIRMPAFLLLSTLIPLGVIEYQRWKPRIYKLFHANKKQ